MWRKNIIYGDCMKYEDTRDLFRNGDVVFFSGGKKSLVRRAITWFTNGPIYHVGIAFWMNDGTDDRLMLAEAQPDGFRIINLSNYKDRDMTVFRSLVPWENIATVISDSTGRVSYDFIDLLFIGLHEKFGMPIPNISGPGEVCSVIVAKILSNAGVKGLDVMSSPMKLYKQFCRIERPLFKVK